MTRRERIVDQLREAKGAYPYLSRLGNANIVRLPKPPLSLATHFSALANSGDLGLLLDVLVVTSQANLDFFAKTLPVLLRQLDRSVSGTQAIVGPGLRGKARWDATYLQRRAGRISAEQFVANVPHKNYSIPQNRLLRRFLEDNRVGAQRLRKAFPTGPVADELHKLAEACVEALKNSYLRDVEPSDYDNTSISITKNLKQSGYKNLAALATVRASVSDRTAKEEWSALLSLLEGSYFEPISEDHLFEVLTLVRVLEAVDKLAGFPGPTNLSLLAGRRNELAEFRLPDSKVTIYFDQTPFRRIFASSYYSKIMSNYRSIGHSARRPDITIHRVNNDGEVVLFVECKNSTQDDYVRKGVYIAFGYLFDFQISAERMHVSAILSVPDLSDPTFPDDKLELANPERADFGDAVARRLGFVLAG